MALECKMKAGRTKAHISKETKYFIWIRVDDSIVMPVCGNSETLRS